MKRTLITLIISAAGLAACGYSDTEIVPGNVDGDSVVCQVKFDTGEDIGDVVRGVNCTAGSLPEAP